MMLLSPTQKYYLYRLVLSFASGVSLASAFAPANEPMFAFAALIVIFYLVSVSEKVSHAALWGMAFGFGWFVSGINWVYFSMYHYGYMPLEWTYVTTSVFSLALALFPTAAFVLVVKFIRNPILRMALALPAAFTFFEWLRGWVLTGFPWLNPAYTMIDWPFAGLAPFIGSFGVLLGMSTVAGLLAAIWTLRGNWIYIASCVITIFSILLLSMAGKEIVWSEPTGDINVRLVQPNLEPRLLQQSMSERFDEIYFYLDNVSVEKPQLDAVILPESAYPLAWQQFPQAQQDRLINWVKTENKSLLFNAFWLEEGRFSNAAVALSPEGEMSLYKKRHLVPFGEFVPWGFRWFIDSMRIPMTDLASGETSALTMNFAGHTAAVNLCYENLFGSEWIEAWGNASPELLINLSNLKWFGPEKASAQHLQISQMRALETARPVLSVTNSGSTALVNEHGQIVKSLATDIEATLDVKVTTMKGEATPFVKWGNWPAVLLSILMLLGAFLCTFAEKRRQKD